MINVGSVQISELMEVFSPLRVSTPKGRWTMPLTLKSSKCFAKSGFIDLN